MKTVVGLFDNFTQAQKAAQDLENAGIPRNDVSIVANNTGGQYDQYLNQSANTTTDTGSAVGADAAAGAVIGGVAGFLMSLGLFLIPGFGPIVAAGFLVSTITGAGIGAVAGGLIGLLVNAGVPHEEAAYYTEGIRRGGTLLAVRAADELAKRAAQILSDDGAVNIEERAAQWRQEGYTPPSAQDTMAGATSTGTTTPAMANQNTNWNQQQPPAPANTPIATTGATTGTGQWGMEHTPRSGDFSSYENDWRNNYQNNYANQGLTYEEYVIAYEFGYNMGTDPRFRGQDWNTVEPQLRSNWEARQPGTWNIFRNAIRYSWDKATGAQRGGIQTGGHAIDGTPDTRGIMEKTADTITGDNIDDKTGKPVS